MAATSSAASAEKTDSSRAASPFSAPQISLPKGGGAIHGIGEKFAMNPVTGTASFSVPIFASPGRSGFGPKLTLSYDSGAGNGPFGLGWHLAIPSITRKTSKGLPQYQDQQESDVFLISDAEDLVPELVSEGAGWVRKDRIEAAGGQCFEVRCYRPRIEGLFARIEKWRSTATGETHWRSISRDNITSLYGRTPQSRIADPEAANRVFQWMLERSWDDKGNAIIYQYKQEELPLGRRRLADRHRSHSHAQANIYLEQILYGNRVPCLVKPDIQDIDFDPNPQAWLFELAFDYAKDHDPAQPCHTNVPWSVRQDPFSTYNATFEVRTWRLCHRVLMFHRFEELCPNPYLVRSTDFTFEENPIATYLVSATQSGYRWDGCQYQKKSYPAVEFDYERLPAFNSEVQELDATSLQNLPVGLENGYQLLDLDGEGISGVLAEQGGAWFYKRSLGEVRSSRTAQSPSAPTTITEQSPVRFGPVQTVAERPNLANAGKHQFLDLAGNGHIDLVLFGEPGGFFERTANESWESFRTFESLPNLNFNDPNLRFVDLTGDGHADILISEDQAFIWHESLAEQGFGAAHRVAKVLDEEKGPAVVFAEEQQTVFLADISGDGLNDLVRVRNGEICYWPNLGYGRFGAKITMEDSPWFDMPEQFDAHRIRLGDLDGSGPADLLYIRHDHVSIWRNQAGNSWRAEETIRIPGFHTLASVNVADLLGRGTACIVWSSQSPGDTGPSLRYIDLVGKEKPHLMRHMINNLGAETQIHYAASTKFYLADQLAGRPWITRLPFPVHVCEKVETFDRISKNYFVTRYAFHHGYFDGVEREFRGFGMVEQWDTESFAALSASDGFPTGDNIDRASHLPPVLTKTWFHTGVFLDRDHISNFYAGLGKDACGETGEYYREPGLDNAAAKALLLEDTILPAGLTLEEQREACRALKGSILRQEIYALDGSLQVQHPYSVSERNYAVRLLQPQGSNRFAVFLTHARETLDYHYERNPADPRISHSLTLEVDEFGNVLKSAAVGYGRRQPDCTLPPRDQQEQTRTLVTYTESTFTNAILEMATAHRVPLPAEVRTYELTGYSPSGSSGRFQFSDLVRRAANGLAHLFDTEISYEQQPSAGRQRRLIEQSRTCYRPDDFGESTGGPLALLPPGEIQSLALAGETYKLAFTPGLLARVYQRNGENLLPDPASVLEGGGYVDLDGNGHWWIPSGRMFHSPGAEDDSATEAAYARRHFYVAQRYRNPFGATTTVTFDAYDLLHLETRDALGNRVTVGERDPQGNLVSQGNDYRVLQPRQMMDPNRNRAAVAFDALGMVVGTAVMGKPEENLGDSLAHFEPDLSETAILDHLSDPFANYHSILGSATSRLVYDLSAYARTKTDSQPQPAVVYTMVRETHVSDLAPGEQTRIQHGFSYSDGFGRELQKKIQAEPGADGKARWVGSGWTVFNNKGKPVRKYEPFFSPTHRFEFTKTVGVSSVLFYDPLERVIATLHPNHTYEKVVFDPWRQVTWDVNDTVLANPRHDPDVGEFFRDLPASEYLPTWYAQRADGALGRDEQAAAVKAAVHANTPTTAYFDTLGRAFLTIAHNKFKYSDTPSSDPPVDEFYTTRVVFDIEGNEREVIDAKNRVVMRYDYTVAGPDKDGGENKTSNRIHQASMEAGERWMLNDIAGKPFYAWDSRNHRFRTAYDSLHRPTNSFLQENVGTELLVGRTVYGERQPNSENNLRGKVTQIFDQAGVVTSDEYDFKGNLLRSQRQLAQEYKATLDWSFDVPLEADIYVSGTRYDALNRPTELISPDSSIIRHGFNEANLLERVEVNLLGQQTDGQTVWTPFVTNINYDAKRQRTLIDYGNGTRTTYTYDPLTFRMTHLLTRRDAAAFPGDCPIMPEADWPGCQVQNLHYTYDPAGNITRICDHAQQTIYFRNKRVDPIADYTYDAIYRLIEATGREHLGQHRAPPAPGSYNDKPRVGVLFSASDGNAMGRYLEHYTYDGVGNFKEMIHRGGDPVNCGWTRSYAYEESSLLEPDKHSNRLTRTTTGAAIETYSSGGNGYDFHGNMLRMPHLQVMQWNFKDQLQMTQRQAMNSFDMGEIQRQGERTWYVYDAAGRRVRKITEGANSEVKDQQIYLGSLEIYRKRGTSPLARQTLHIMDGEWRLALVETRTKGNDGSPAQLIRYQLSNRLGSVSLELNDQAGIVSYEEYYPYGSSSYESVSSQTTSPKRYRYASKERDEESGLHSYGARYYAAWLHRFISVDPMVEQDLGHNPYGYAANNPTTLIDSLGLMPGDPPTSTPQQALDRIDKLATLLPKTSESFPHVNSEEFLTQLKNRVQHPDALNQGEGTDLCWAAACMSYAYTRDPEGMAIAMCGLFKTGEFKYATGSSNELSLTPSNGAKKAVGSKTFDQNPGLKDNKVDQMLLMTLASDKKFRGSTNIDRHYGPGDQNNLFWAGRTFEATVRMWRAFGFDIESWGSSTSMRRDLHRIAAAELEKGHDVVLFVHGPKFRDKQRNGPFGTHFIRVRNMKHDTLGSKTGNWTFECWDYGHEKWRSKTISNRQFSRMTYGVISSRSH